MYVEMCVYVLVFRFSQGKLKFVDKRMKKDARAMKRIEKNKKKRKK